MFTKLEILGDIHKVWDRCETLDKLWVYYNEDSDNGYTVVDLLEDLCMVFEKFHVFVHTHEPNTNIVREVGENTYKMLRYKQHVTVGDLETPDVSPNVFKACVYVLNLVEAYE